MSRYLGSKHRLCRRVGERLCTTDKCPTVRRNYPPGAHGPTGKSRLTSFGIQLREKQKAKWIYGLLERQFRGYFQKAKKIKGDTGQLLGEYLEMRLDNIVYRMGWAKTRRQARQIVKHGLIEVNGKKLDIPSYVARPNDIIMVKKVAQDKAYFKNILPNLEKHELPSWLNSQAHLTGKVLNAPPEEELRQNFDAKLIVEFYSR